MARRTARSPVSGRSERRPPRPLDPESLQRLALAYVERFATTRGRLVDYLNRKLRERGWVGQDGGGAEQATVLDPDALAERFAELGYLDDRAYAEAKASAMTRRGLGARRVRDVFRRDGIEAGDADALLPAVDARAAEAALAYARRKRLGPWAAAVLDRDELARRLAAMARAGHPYPLARAVLELPPGEPPEPEDVLRR